MNTPIKTRAAALLASLLLSIVTVQQMADYAYPQAPAAVSASADAAASVSLA